MSATKGKVFDLFVSISSTKNHFTIFPCRLISNVRNFRSPHKRPRSRSRSRRRSRSPRRRSPRRYSAGAIHAKTRSCENNVWKQNTSNRKQIVCSGNHQEVGFPRAEDAPVVVVHLLVHQAGDEPHHRADTGWVYCMSASHNLTLPECVPPCCVFLPSKISASRTTNRWYFDCSVLSTNALKRSLFLLKKKKKLTPRYNSGENFRIFLRFQDHSPQG